MKKNLLVTAMILLFLATSCWHGRGVRGSGIIDEEVRQTSDFTMIELNGAYSVEIEQADENKITIIAEDNILPLVKTKVRGDKLIIENKRSISPREEIIVKIKVKKLERLESSGANDVYATKIECDRFDVDMSGASSIELEGKVDIFNIDLSGAGSIKAKDLIANEVRIDLSGASSASVYAKKKIRGDLSGVGSIDYYGDPEDVDVNKSGLGSITRK